MKSSPQACLNSQESILYLRNRKHLPRFYRVIETRVEVWENEKCCWNTSRRRGFPHSLRCSRFLSFFSVDRTSERKSGRAKEHAWGEQKIGEKWEGCVREGGGGGEKRNIGVSFAGLTPSLCSLFFALPPSFVTSRKFLETPATQAIFNSVFEFSQTFTNVSI